MKWWKHFIPKKGRGNLKAIKSKGTYSIVKQLMEISQKIGSRIG